MEAGKYVKIGRIVKPFGYKGDLKVLLDITYKELIESLEGFTLEAFFIFKQERSVPYFIEKITPQQSEKHILVKLEDIHSKEEGLLLSGKEIHLPQNMISLVEETGIYAAVIGFMAEDGEAGELGRIEDILQLPHQEIAQINFRDQELLVPLNEETVINIDHPHKKILLKLPKGLLDVYLS